jgi:hypothetical protein
MIPGSSPGMSTVYGAGVGVALVCLVPPTGGLALATAGVGWVVVALCIWRLSRAFGTLPAASVIGWLAAAVCAVTALRSVSAGSAAAPLQQCAPLAVGVTLAFAAHAKTGLARAAGDRRGVRHAGVVGTLGLLVALTFAVVTTLDVAADHWRQPLVVVVASVGLLGLVAFLALLKGPAAAPVPAVVAVGPTVNRRGV